MPFGFNDFTEDTIDRLEDALDMIAAIAEAKETPRSVARRASVIELLRYAHDINDDADGRAQHSIATDRRAATDWDAFLKRMGAGNFALATAASSDDTPVLIDRTTGARAELRRSSNEPGLHILIVDLAESSSRVPTRLALRNLNGFASIQLPEAYDGVIQVELDAGDPVVVLFLQRQAETIMQIW